MRNSYKTRAILAMVLSAGAAAIAPAADAAAVSATSEILDIYSWGYGDLTSDRFFVQTATTPVNDGFNAGTVASDLTYNYSNGGNTSYAVSNLNAFDLPYTTAGVTNSGAATSSFQYTVNWAGNGDGTMHVVFDYQSVAQLINLAGGETAGVSSLLSVTVDGTGLQNDWFTINGGSTQYNLGSFADIAFHYFANQAGTISDFNTVDVAFEVLGDAAGEVTFSLASQAYANPVPVPAAVWLLGSALTGLGVIGRRRQAA